MKERPKKYSRLEIMVRIKDHDGWTRSEWVFREGRVELINYWANGQIELQHEVSVETFYAAFQKMVAAREAVPA